jgi:hypothetical protein
MPFEHRPDGDHDGKSHTGNMKMDCGSIFHCPFIFNANISAAFHLPLIGKLILIAFLPFSDGSPSPVYHPPKNIVSI